MEARAVLRYVPIAPRKVRLIADLVRNRDVNSALDILKFTNKAGAVPVEKVIRSALANAGQNSEIGVDDLYIKTIYVDNGPIRYWARFKGRLHINRIRRRRCHITVILDDGAEQ
ncbi:50S ribosomal protein L22 [Candidatus Poribacteria bacterium]|nr:50S ribosomal protein L22 [Candidatus Poribacteria bacterium]